MAESEGTVGKVTSFVEKHIVLIAAVGGGIWVYTQFGSALDVFTNNSVLQAIGMGGAKAGSAVGGFVGGLFSGHPDTLKGQVDANTEVLKDHETRIGSLEDTVEDHETRISGLEDTVEDHEKRLVGVENITHTNKSKIFGFQRIT